MTREMFALCLALFEEAETAPAEWVSPPCPPSGTMYVGSGGEWTITVARFSIEDQGFPPGSVGYDGALRKGTTIVHMTREVAERLFKRAEREHNERQT